MLSAKIIHIINIILLKELFEIPDSFLVFRFVYLQYFPKKWVHT